MRLPVAIFITAATLVLAQGPPGYAPAAACASCHSSIAATFAQTAMARSFRVITPALVLPEFQNQQFFHAPSSQSFRAFTRDGRPFLRRETAEGIEKEAHYVFGSGNHARSFLHRTAANRLIELPLTWYARAGGYWSMSPAFDRPDHPGFTREIGFQCLFCHNAYPAMADPDPLDIPVFPAALPEGIDCQRCHGPGAAHAAAPSRAAIVNPAKLPPARQLEICLQCHLETTSLRLPASLLRPGRGVFSFRPGEPLEDYALHFSHAGLASSFDFVSAATRMRQSPCFRKSAGRMTCTTCHNPHQVQRGATFDTACQNCHPVLAATHTPARNCAGCHMPKRRPSDVIHAEATDHLVVAKPAASPAPTVERHDGNTPPFRGPVTLYYPPQLPPSPANEILLAIAQAKQGANPPDALAALLKRHSPANSQPYFEYAEALRNAGRLAESLPAYQQALARPPASWAHFYGYGLALAAAGQPALAATQFQRASALAPAEPAPWFGLGTALVQRNQPAAAMAALRRALALNPDLPDVRNNLGSLLLAANDRNAAIAEFSEAVRLRPDLTAARLNLATALLRQQRYPEAVLQAEAAAASASSPQRFRAHLTWGLALLQQGRAADARLHFEIAAQSPEPEVRNLSLQLKK